MSFADFTLKDLVETETTYGELLDMLRADLQLDLSTDVLAGTPTALARLGITTGTVTLTFTASTLSGNVVVIHGLPTTPSVVVASALAAPAAGQIPTPNVFSLAPATFTINGETKTSWTGTVTMNWLARI